METFSTTTTHQVPSLLHKSFIPTSNHPLLFPFKPPPPSPLSTAAAAVLTNKTNPNTLKPLTTSFPPHQLTQTPQTHRKAATGYAAALLDVACCDGVVGVVARDVRRVKRVVDAVLGDERVEGGMKAKVARRVVEAGGFYPKVVVLVRMLVKKGKGVGVVVEVMEEFVRLWEELCGGVKGNSNKKSIMFAV